MAYFNHAFQKVFWAASGAGGGATGYINSAGVTSVNLLPTYGVGAVTFADQDSAGWPSVAVAPANGEPLTLVATSLYQNDKVGNFHGGYQETTKSKMVNPKFISKFYRVDSNPGATNIIGVGATPNLDLSGADATCCPVFYCNENYYMRFDLKGSPALRVLNHNAYHVSTGYTGCCDGPVPELVDPADVMAAWINDVILDPILFGANHGPSFAPITSQRLVNVGMTVTCDDGATWDLYLPDNFQAGTAGVYFEADGITLNATGIAFQTSIETATGVAFAGVATPLGSYVSIFDPLAPNCCAGLVMESAFVETRFGDCTFMPSDHFEVEPLLIQASMLDETGDPCVFEQLCISDGITPSGVGTQTVYPAIQFGTQVMGTGEQVLRDLILSESYSQNYFNKTDLRIREITQGYDMTNAVDRGALYTSYFILHTVPRYNNPSGTFDNDQYLLKVPMDAPNVAFETFMLAWMANAGNPIGNAPMLAY